VTELARELAQIAEELSPGHLEAWAKVLRNAPSPSPDVEAALIDARPGYAMGAVAGRLVRAWRLTQPTPQGAELALCLEAAGHIQALRRAERSVVVVSGPVSDAVPVRMTSQVAIEVIRSAQSSLLVVSFAAYGVHEVIAELNSAALRGIALDLVFEGTGNISGPLTGAAQVFKALQGRATFWHWPLQHRPSTGASLHAKLIAADEHTALIGSANLTDRALHDNLEIGIVLREKAAVQRMVHHFHALMNPGAGTLKRAALPLG
jgi:putative cardiolipin synthase